ncbi:MAG: M20 family metallopeptidase [Nitrospinota bacterium]|nr:M20 family metallopeptidase [Nitrospinota bacterium]
MGKKIDQLTKETIELTRALVQIPSENPNGNESKVVGFLESFFKKNNIPVEKSIVTKKRENLIVEIGERKNKSLAFVNHMDTVPAGDGWKMNPFSGKVSKGKLWGRGSCDMKGGIASSLIALKEIKRKIDAGKKFENFLKYFLVVDEESAWMEGVSHEIDKGKITKKDIVISCEPTSLDLVIAQKGAMWYEIEIKGKNAHAASPHMGINAIHASCVAIENLNKQFEKKDFSNPLLGKTTFVPSIIQGGRKTNMVADQCKFQIDVRFIPPLTIKKVGDLIKDTIHKSCRMFPGTKGSVQTICIDRPPIISNEKSYGGELIRRVLRENFGSKSKKFGVSYYSDAGVVASRTKNKQCFLLGPGNIEQAHSPNEFVNIKELSKATKIYLDIIQKHLL